MTIRLPPSDKPSVLVLLGCYLPGYKSGGPIRTIANLVEHLGDSLDFKILTSDRDALDTKPYENVYVDQWNRVGKAQVFYASPRGQSLQGIASILQNTPHDVLYFNSFFNPVFTFRPLLLRGVRAVPITPSVIAVRGEMAPAALALKSWKKLPYRRITTAVGLYNNMTWQASSAHEMADIKRELSGPARRILIAPDLPPPKIPVFVGATPGSAGHPLKLVFLSRITPMKNLDYALRVISEVSVPVEFNIYGPIRDEPYWTACQELIPGLPDNIRVFYRGSVHPSNVGETLAEHDLFLLPTRGENYGHVIPEALSAGVPVLISDATPWRGLESEGVGWDLPLDSPSMFTDKIERCARMSPKERLEWKQRIQAWATKRLSDQAAVDANLDMFLSMIPEAKADRTEVH